MEPAQETLQSPECLQDLEIQMSRENSAMIPPFGLKCLQLSDTSWKRHIETPVVAFDWSNTQARD